ncbi:hypothetical protein LTR20_007225 [Exophiala xenobiotica]|nr:hypothetical protein LTS13_006545 [Exophiala xenobiotica]KAK5401086.1 hypothetical protein LTR79_001605 [Exophiala xenobiotica]KAK5409014.1 hypothetical protein LTR90_009137 [Exophiala xenobiotica]KAK5459918.1 hypothetical protein LTR20_007225 [Exophiala xenobiotica]KAK5488855.1 hypothetical protein LTR26_004171 [Exophiala xenobiotica]
MSLFHRRSRSQSASRPQTPASASAHLAASQAFLANRVSQGNLSASAAATALRALSPTPTPVDQVQTKRMVQRQASFSQSSTGSGRGRSRGGLQRQQSASSMTERTFRTPSPSPSRQTTRPESELAPPLPNIPQQYTSPVVPAKKKKRASSQGAPPPRVLSPPPTGPTRRGQSVDRFGSSQPVAATKKSSHLPKVPELERTDSRNSVNFSRPLSPRPQSPVPSPTIANGDRSMRKPAVAAISPTQAEQIQYGLVQTANQPVKKKKKKTAPASSEGSHLHSGTMASKPVVQSLESDPESHRGPDAQHRDEEEPQGGRGKNKAGLSGESTHFPPSDTSYRTDSDSDSNAERSKDRRAQRASGVLAKQPSIVREDWEGEQDEETGRASPLQVQTATGQDDATPLQNKRAINTANVSRKIEEPPPPTKTITQAVPAEAHANNKPSQPQSSPAVSANLQVTEPRSVREASLSPSRSTRFSDRLSSDLAAGRKHEPLPRSVSPAKSALKHHSPSGSDLHQARIRGSSVTPSESSDVSSASAEGPARRKKSARVSFDAQPEVVAISDGIQSSDSPGKEKKSWLGAGKSRPTLNTIPSNDDMEELMKPRPQLPSFGSVRGQKSRDANDANAPQASRSPPASVSTATSTPSLRSNASSANTYPSTGISSDHAVGAILSQEAQKQSRDHSNEPLPPEVTSVQGTVSFSDSESDTSEIEDAPQSAALKNVPMTEKPIATTEPTSSINHQVTMVETPPMQEERPAELPVFSIIPPTPKADDQWEVYLPGGFPVSRDALAQLEESQKDNSSQPGLGIDSNTDSESDNESIYSDAAEDPAELEGTGFGSIDAIVDSPMAAAQPTRITPPESPLARAPESRPQPPVSTDSWEQTQARWRDLAEQTRNPPSQLSKATEPAQTAQPKSMAVEPAVDQQAPPQQPVQAMTALVSAPRPKKKKNPAAIAAAASPAAVIAEQGLPSSRPRKKKQPPAYPKADQGRVGASDASAGPFRQSMRTTAPPEAEPTMRKSMRDRNSMPATATAPQHQRLHQASMKPPTQPRAALQKKHIPPTPLSTSAAASASSPRKAPVQPAATNDSDSESSFRKARRSKATSGGQYNMRRSMRGAPDPTLRDDGRNGVRSVSPAARRPFSPAGGQRTMRASMRGSVDSSVPTLRGSTDNKRSSSLFGRRQGSVPPLPPAAAPKLQSRFVDSDDEETAPRAKRFRSRFADDSDDDSDLTPVRGIPRRARDGDSTDLDDSSDEEKPRTPVQPARLQIPQSTMSPAGTEPMSPNTEKKRGLFGRLRGKKQKDAAPSPIVESPQAPPPADLSKPSNLGFSSKVERDRVIEQTRARLEASQPPQPRQQPPNKLQRRQTPQRGMSDSWPLPPKMSDHMNDRPNTADGPTMRNGSARLNQGSMRTREIPMEPVGQGGKKKRFPMLRKAFGLKD